MVTKIVTFINIDYIYFLIYTKMKKLIVVSLLFVGCAVFAQKPIFTTAKTTAATVYFNAAELTQTTTVNLPIGTSEIVIKNVANSVNESTIQIGVPSTVTVLSTQFTDNYISEFEADENNPKIKKVRDSINLVLKEIKKIQIQIAATTQTSAILDKNQAIGGTNSGLNVAELIKLVDFYKLKRIELDNSIVELQEREQNCNIKLQNLTEKLEINSKNIEKSSAGKLILQVLNSASGNATITFSYITNTATWAPFYDLRADNVLAPLQLIYKAQVTQNSGIDWKKVALKLSSGMPNQNNAVPLLQPWFLKYKDINANYGYVKKVQADYEMMQSAPALKAKSATKTATINATISENQLNIAFDIAIPYDIASNGKVHSVALKELQIPVRYKYYTAPRIEREAYLMAEINNYSTFNLLQGDANIIFEDLYVGKTNINPNETTDTLKINMGRDKRISIKRDKIIDKSGIKFLSSFKEQTFTFETTIRNNKKEPIEILLNDQFPISTNKDIIVDLLENDDAKINLETGILSWTLKLASSSSTKIRISYKVRYPKDQNIDNL